MSHKTAATVAPTIGIDTGKNTLHLIGLDDKGAIVLRDIDTALMDSLKALDPEGPIREAVVVGPPRHVRKVPNSEISNRLISILITARM